MQTQKEANYLKIIETFEHMLFRVNNNIELISMNNLVKEVGLTKRTIYKHFDSKRELHFEAMIRGYQHMNDYIRNHLENEQDDSLKTVFEAFYEYSLKFNSYYNLILKYQTTMADFDNPTERVKMCYELGQETISFISKAIKKGIDDGSFKGNLNLDETVIMVWSFAVGLLNNMGKKQSYLEKYYNIDKENMIQHGIYEIINILKKG